jgi:hypothetical protein
MGVWHADAEIVANAMIVADLCGVDRTALSTSGGITKLKSWNSGHPSFKCPEHSQFMRKSWIPIFCNPEMGNPGILWNPES